MPSSPQPGFPMPSYLNALGLLCALGEGKQAVADALLAGDASGMRAEDGWVSDRRGYRYDRCDPQSGEPWPAMPAPFLSKPRP